MPTYLLHGFRWPRPLIRIHVVLQNLDDAAADWLVAPPTTRTLLRNFNALYPDCMEHLNQLRFVEQYDPNDTTPSQPYAYVADLVEEVKLGVAVDDVVSKGIGNEQWAAMMELRDKLAPEETVSWYVVVCGDEERWPPTPPEMMTGINPSGTPSPEREGSGGSDHMGGPRNKPAPAEDDPGRMKKLFGSMNIGKRKSRMMMPDLERSRSYSSLVQNAPEPIIGIKPMLPNTAAWQSQPSGGIAANGVNPQPVSAASSNGRSSHFSNISNGDSSSTSNPNSTSPPSSHATEARGEPKELLPSTATARADLLTRSDVPITRASRRATIGSNQDVKPKRLVSSSVKSTSSNSESPPNFDQVSKRFNTDPDSQQRISSRRNSNVPAFSNSPISPSPRASSPEQFRRAYSPVSMIRSPDAATPRNGTMSPVSTLRNEGIVRSASPLRSEITSNYSTARSSPVSTMRSTVRTNKAAFQRDSNASALQAQAQHIKQAHEHALAALQGEISQPAAPSSPKKQLAAHKMKQRLSLVTHVPAPATVLEEEEEEEEGGEYERVISLSPVASSPIMSYRRSRSSLMLSGIPGNGSSSTLHLSGMNLTSREGDRPYFGQAVDHRELVATGIENAFDRL